MVWKRPEDVPFPSIWRRFDGRKPINGKIPKFWVQDIPEEMFDEAIDIMCSNFIYDEPLCRYANITEDPMSVEEIKEVWKKIIHDKVGLMCFMENPDPKGKPIIAGMNMTYVSHKGEKIPDPVGKTWKKILNTVLYLCYQVDAYEKLDINEYMGALGLSVLPEFRGQGLGLEILNARSDLCKAVGLKATLTVFTATASQKLAEKSNFKDLISMTYDELAEKEPEWTYPGINEHTKSIRYMYKMID